MGNNYKQPEVYLDLEGTTNYQISSYGNFRRLLAKGGTRQIKPFIVKDKWMAVKVVFKGVYKEFFVHHLMANTFLEPSTVSGQVLYHKNGLIRDNYAGNLAWIDKKTLGKKTGSKNDNGIPVLQLDLVTGEIVSFFKSIREAARNCYVSREAIRCVVVGKQKTAGGYKWRRENVDEVI